MQLSDGDSRTIELVLGLILFCILWEMWRRRPIKQSKIVRPKAKVYPPLDQSIIDLAVLHFSKPLNMIPKSEISIGRNISSIYVARELLKILDELDHKVVSYDKYGYGDEIIRRLETAEIIVFEKKRSYA